MNDSKKEILTDDDNGDEDIVYIMDDDTIEYLIDVSDTNNRLVALIALIAIIAIFQFLSSLLNIFIFVKIIS